MADPKDRLEVVCPCCKGTLTIDIATGMVLHAVPATGPRTDFESVLGQIRAAEGSRDEQFRKAFQSENARRATLDKKFEVAREKAAADPDKKPFNPMDYD